MDTSAAQLARTLWHAAGGDPAELPWLDFSNTASQLPSPFAVGALAAASVGVQALAAASLWRARGGQPQSIVVDQRHALALFRSERLLLVDGAAPPDPWSPLSGFYQAGDARWIQLHTNFAHHRDGVLDVLGLPAQATRAQVAAAILRWQAAALDTRLAEAGLCAALVRSPAEWAASAQAQAVATLPLFDIEAVADAPRPVASGPPPARPLAGVRVLDLSRVIAAPVAARTLAQHGADVLAVSAAHLPNLPAVVIDTGRGKRACQLDLRDPAQRATLCALIREADVFLHAYRPGALAAFGFSTAALQALRPGLIEVQLSAYSHAGPWAGRRGFDSLVQSASGIAWEAGMADAIADGSADGIADRIAAGIAADAAAAGDRAGPGPAQIPRPGKLPCQALDHASGYLAACAAMVALRRRDATGGGWRVRVSLAQTGRLLQRLPRVSSAIVQRELSAPEIDGYREATDSPFGRVSAVTPAETMSLTPPRFALPPAPLDAHRPEWV